MKQRKKYKGTKLHIWILQELPRQQVFDVSAFGGGIFLHQK